MSTALDQISSFQLLLYDAAATPKLSNEQLIASSPAQLIILANTEANVAVDRTIADPLHKKLLIGCKRLTRPV